MFASVTFAPLESGEAVLLGAFEGAPAPAGASPAVEEALARPEFRGKLGQVVEVLSPGEPRRIVVGLGKAEALTPVKLRQAAGEAARRVARCRAESLVINLPLEGRQHGKAVGEAFGLLAWTQGLFRTEDEAKPELVVCGVEEGFALGLEEGLGMAKAVNFARTLAATPPNIATPEWMSDKAAEVAAENGLNLSIVSGRELEAERMAGLMAVGQASANPPCLIRLEYCPPGLEDEPAIILLGKTITYDTGGLSLKTKDGMPGMKKDKSGGCAVLGAMKAIASVLRPQARVVGILVAAENSVSSSAYRPDDVIIYRDGTSVEVTNTDAEGRLVLADGLCWIKDKEIASCVVDAATLTGGVVTALGSEFAGCFATDDATFERLKELGEAAGERVWRLPLDEAYKPMMKSQVADLINSKSGGRAHPVQGATFLWAFVPEGMDWTHLDIAGVSSTDSDKGCWQPGPTGWGVRLMAEFVADRSRG